MSGLVSAAIVGSITYIISILIVATAKAAPVNKKVDDKGREQGKRKGKKIQRRGKYYWRRVDNSITKCIISQYEKY